MIKVGAYYELNRPIHPDDRVYPEGTVVRVIGKAVNVDIPVDIPERERLTLEFPDGYCYQRNYLSNLLLPYPLGE